jgi:hypothetical protein
MSAHVASETIPVEVIVMTKTTRRFVLLGVLFYGSVFALAAATEPDGGMGVRTPTSTGTYDHETLQADARMTQGMSRPDANTGAQYHRSDEQLAHSSSSSFLRDFEAHQADIDRMLARTGP